jgi:hypothetical protein
MSATTLAVALATSLLSVGRVKAIALTCAAVAGAGIWVSGGRALFLLGASLVALALIAPGFAERRRSFARAIPIVIVGLVLVFLFSLLVPTLLRNRLEWYQSTLDPRSPQNEWTYRWSVYGRGTVEGVRIGGLFGIGTGQESLGKPYLQDDPDSNQGLYQVESGFGSVAVEWGIVGLSLWILWTLKWLWRAGSSVRQSRDGPPGVAAAGFVLAGWLILTMTVQFFTGYSAFQNFLQNAYFWLISGIVFGLAWTGRQKLPAAAAPASAQRRKEPVAQAR